MSEIIFIVMDSNSNLHGGFYQERKAMKTMNELIRNHRPIGEGETRGEVTYKIIEMKVEK